MATAETDENLVDALVLATSPATSARCVALFTMRALMEQILAEGKVAGRERSPLRVVRRGCGHGPRVPGLTTRYLATQVVQPAQLWTRRREHSMRVLLAPDKFKGCMTGRDAALAMQRGVAAVVPQAEVLVLPVADGGEGTMDVLVSATGGTLHTIGATGPLGAQLRARYALLGDGETAVVEMAQASGLALVPLHERNPMQATSFGTGELILAALDRGARRLVVGIGGSATNDAGAGMLQALGARLVDGHGDPIALGGGALSQLAAIDLSTVDERLSRTFIEVACDVRNPLCGPDGATRIYGPQKGATPQMVAQLEANLAHFAALLERDCGLHLAALPGGGAAGGLGAALLACGAILRPGIELVLDALRFDEKLRGQDLVLTGEGCMDEQTVEGKVIAGLAARCDRAGVPLVAFAGILRPGYETLLERGLTAAYAITPADEPLEAALRNGAVNLERAVSAFLTKSRAVLPR